MTMFNSDKRQIDRRCFLEGAGALAGGAAVAGPTGILRAAQMDRTAGGKEIPRRVLGRTGQQVTMLALGTSGAGFSTYLSSEDIAKLVYTALEEGVRYIDTARRYGNAEEGVGRALLGGRRKEVFLSTKVYADTIAQAEQSLHTSFRMLKTDYFDLVHFHNLGMRDMSRALGPDGVFNWLVKQKKAGKFRFLGISGHNRVGRFARFLETGEVDVLLCVINFADRYTYGFEEKVLPIARKHNVGIVAMKVYGGIRAGDTLQNLLGPPHPPSIHEQYLDLAVRYALSVPGVAAVSIGAYHPHEIRQNAERVRNYRPLTEQEQAFLEKLGRQYAAQWGEHFGPAGET